MGAQRVAVGIRRAIAVTTLVGYLAGCTGWHNIGTVAPVPAPERPQFLRLTLQSGNRLELRDARIVGDSVVGQAGVQPNQVRTAIAMSDVRQIADRRISAGYTTATILGILAGVTLVGGLIAVSSVHTFGN